MANPFKIIAPGMFIRGAIFCILGLILLGEAIPTLFALDRAVLLLNIIVGAALFSLGVKDLFYAAKQAIDIQDSKLDCRAIDYLYTSGNGGDAIPGKLMTACENPNEEGQPYLVQWLARLFPRLDYLPYPYTAVLHSVFVAFGLGVVGLVTLLLLRIMLTYDAQISLILDWYYWFYILIGLVFWVAASRCGFVSVQRFQENLLPPGIVTLFMTLLFGAVLGAYLLAKSRLGLAEPPDLPALTAIIWAGTIALIVVTFAMTVFRSRGAPVQYSISQEEEYFTLGMHPTDVINTIKAHTRSGLHWLLGSWKPSFAEHTAVEAGEFEANLNAEYNVRLGNSQPQGGARIFGVLVAWIGMMLSTVSGFFFWNATGNSLESWGDAANSFSTPIALMMFGGLFYRLGTIPVAELEWNSIFVYCHMEGTFQKQGSMALVNASDHRMTGSVLTNATVRVHCAIAKSVGFFAPAVAKLTVPRQIYNVEQAPQVANELLAAIQERANRFHNIGLEHPVARPSLTNQSTAGMRPKNNDHPRNG